MSRASPIRDRLTLAHDLSGEDNFVSPAQLCILWFAKSSDRLKFRRLYTQSDIDEYAGQQKWIESSKGKVQCIYIDPPYGIRFNSNFQWSTTSRDVRDGNEGHITREPEQVLRRSETLGATVSTPI